MTEVAYDTAGATGAAASGPGARVTEQDFKAGAASPVKKVLTLTVVIVPILAVIATPFIWGFNWVDIGVFFLMYSWSALGITIGFHRYGTHQGFKTSSAVEAFLLFSGSLALQGPVFAWIADHRRHHKFSDREGDPHSPHVGHDGGLMGAVLGFGHAHVGWLITGRQSSYRRYVPDLLKDPVARRIDGLFFPWIFLLTFAIPFCLGWVLKGNLDGALLTLLIAGPVRLFVVDHVTWSVNSICHMMGSQPFEVNDESRNNWWLGLFTLGEAGHNNHHAFQTSAFHAYKSWERFFDLTGVVIALMERLGLIWGVVRIDPERVAAKRRPAAA